MHEIQINCFNSQACRGKNMVRLTDHLDMTIAVDWDIKPQTKQTKNISDTSSMVSPIR